MTNKLFLSAIAAFLCVLLSIFSVSGLVGTMLKPDVFGGHHFVFVMAMILAGGCGMFTVIYFGGFVSLALATEEDQQPTTD